MSGVANAARYVTKFAGKYDVLRQSDASNSKYVIR